MNKILLFCLLLFVSVLNAQNLNISATGETGTSGANWSAAGTNPVIINVTGAANINRTVIQGYLSTSNVIVNNTNGSITVAADIMSTTNSDLTLKAVGNIFQNANVTVSTDGGDIIFWSDSNNNGFGAIQLKNAGTNGGSVSTNGGDIIMGGGADPLTDYAMANNGTVLIDSQPYGGVWLRYGSLNAGGGNISINGSNGSLVASTRGIYSTESTIQTSGNGTITLNGDGGSSIGATNPWGMSIGSTTIQSDSGSIYIYGISNATTAGNERGIVIGGYIQSLSGDIYIEDRTTSATQTNYTTNFNGIYMPISIGKGTLPSSSSNVYIRGNEIQTESITAIETTGNIEITPYTGETTFTNTLTWNGTNTGSNLTIGNMTNTADIIIGNVTTIGEDIIIYGGAITINNKLEATNTITLDASESITDGTSGYIIADELALLGGAVTLDNEINHVNIIAASNLDAITYVNYEALEIGNIESENGVTSTGAIDIATLSGDLTISQDIITQDTTNDAIVLNAGKSATIGTATGGDIIVSETPTINKGANGIAKLFSGSNTTSIGLTALAGGVTNARFGVDETTVIFDPVLEPNTVYALYREASLGIPEVLLSELKLYPNPAQTGRIQFMLSGFDPSATVTLYNTLGQQISVNTKINGTDLEVTPTDNLNSGMYIVVVKLEGSISQLKWLVEL